MSKKKVIINLSAIALLAVILRIIGLNKLDGMWYDEVLIYHQANNSFPFGIIDATINKDHHYPFYHLMLNLWMQLFGNSDVILRAFSVLPGVLSVFVAYLCGKEMKSDKTGLFMALFVSVNSLMIYYSQEVKFYSLLFLLSFTAALFAIKAIKNPDRKSFIGLGIANAIIMYTFLLGFAFVFVELLVLLLYFAINQRHNLKKYVKAQLYTSIAFLPSLAALVYMYVKDTESFLNGFSAFQADGSLFWILIQNWFSPAIIGLLNNPLNYVSGFFANIGFQKIVFVFLPVAICLVGIYKAIINKDKYLSLFAIGLSFLLLQLLAMVFTDFVCITRYTILSVPFVLVFAVYGLDLFKNKKLAGSLVGIYTVICLSFIMFFPNSAPKQIRISGHRLPAIVFNKYHLNDQDIFVYPIREYLVDKYYPINGEKISILKTFINKDMALNTILDHEDIEVLNKENSREVFRDYLSSLWCSNKFSHYMKTNVYDKLEKGRYFVIVVNINMAPFSPDVMQKITHDDDLYNRSSLLFMQLSKLTNDIFDLSVRSLKPFAFERINNWQIFVFQKQ